MFTTSKEYPDLNIKGFPCTSLPTIVAYKLALFIGHILICDITSCKPTSLATEEFNTNPPLIKFLQDIKFMPVPQDVKVLIDYLNPVLDTQRKNLKFVPSLAGFSLLHDFGHSIPISCFIAMHHIFATTKTNSDPLITMARIYNTEILTVNGSSYTIGNIFGGPYTLENNTHIHNNWINNALEAFINPVVSSTLLQRPTFAKSPMVKYDIDDATQANGYQYLLGHPELNYRTLHSVLTDVSRFIHEPSSSLPLLGNILDQCSGLTIMTHSIESLTLPTWHALPQCVLPTKKDEELNLTPQTDDAYAKIIDFLQTPPVYKGTFKYNDTDIEPDLYLVEEHKFVPAENPLDFLTYSEKKFRNAQVIWFQPYDKSSQSIELAIPLGLRIVNPTIDGITIPLPHPSINLTQNNSNYKAGSIPISHIQSYIPTSTPVSSFNQLARQKRTLITEPLGHSIRDMSRNVLPVMCNENVAPEAHIPLSGFTIERHHACPAQSGTVIAWKSNSTPPNMPKSNLYLWSSYRHIDYHPFTGNQTIHMYSTLRGLYGTCVTLTKSTHPSLLLPA